jgi:hypothetical protein
MVDAERWAAKMPVISTFKACPTLHNVNTRVRQPAGQGRKKKFSVRKEEKGKYQDDGDHAQDPCLAGCPAPSFGRE